MPASSKKKPFGNPFVGIHAAVAQEGPVAARLLDQRAIDLAQHDLFRIVPGLGDDAAEGIGQKAAAPELDSLPFGATSVAVASDLAMLQTHAVHGSYVDAVGDGVRALDGPPRVKLCGAELVLLCRVPADGRGIKQELRSL